MDVSSMLSERGTARDDTSDLDGQHEQYSARHGGTQPSAIATAGSLGRASPSKKDQKHVSFQLIDNEDPRIQARLPMRVMISSHDSTDSIITTVKNFYGLYDYGVSFENSEGIGIIAAYDNFDNDMTVYVRTIMQRPTQSNAGSEQRRDPTSPRKPTLGAPFEMRPPQTHNGYSPSKSGRSVVRRSASPTSEAGRRSASGIRPRSTKHRSRENSAFGDDGYSSGDNGEGSVTSSRRSKTEQVNAEISVDNIVEGGRRKRAFESSELPLFVPPQVPMSTSVSSVSPQRRSLPGAAASPYAPSNQQTFAFQHPLPSPMSHGSGQFAQPTGSGFGSKQQRKPGPQYRSSNGGILPTPDPTVGSAISDEDVALQLMRLGDVSNFSHGRTSNSTADDALSGKAEAASSEEEDSEDDSEETGFSAVPRYTKDDWGPSRKKQRTGAELASDGTSGEEYEDYRDATFRTDGDLPLADQRKSSKLKTSKVMKPKLPGLPKQKTQKSMVAKIPMSPSSMPAPSRKGSIASTINFQHQLAADEEDLSSKPRCQRCRKSKKGCDRQRPCGRCRDAGIGIEGCISEDEGNGRKGRYGRHMGVPVKKGEHSGSPEPVQQQTAQQVAPANGYNFIAPAAPSSSSTINNNKKRKR
ncbi:hypothetical protein K431DRAFT_321501 [Polychaeton citri CBS 116435]|uniref:Zn(2)-C6 fungal-type domain-containing protein n=1 Tax=Polychaeton citri CBS 116435 TaxID=1314669 RepID=A0A9P4UP89_9PEZI|nr:hypothetical protein K431DRAFT_321501 [Polychaeton citri CBS 116435]